MSDNHLDHSVLAALQEVMEDDYPLLLDTFMADSDERLQALHDAQAAADAQAMRLAAHSFKGSCSNMGARALAETCRELEEVSRRGLLSEAPELIERVEQQYVVLNGLLLIERQRFSN